MAYGSRTVKLVFFFSFLSALGYVWSHFDYNIVCFASGAFFLKCYHIDLGFLECCECQLNYFVSTVYRKQDLYPGRLASAQSR